MAPTDETRPARPRAKKPAGAKTPKKPAPPARATKNATPPGNGHTDWVDYEAETSSWDPWDETEGGAEARGLDRTLGEWLVAVVPPEAQVHFFNAGREFAAGLQATVEHHLHRGGEDDGGGAQALRIEIE